MGSVEPPCAISELDAESDPSGCKKCNGKDACPVLFEKSEADIESNIEYDHAGDIPDERMQEIMVAHRKDFIKSDRNVSQIP